MKKFFNDFKAFITKGNIIDLATAVIIGGAFGKIVTSLVDNIIMPLITLAVKGISVSDWKYVIKPEEVDTVTGQVLVAESAIRYGLFIQSIIDFLIIAFFIFLALRILMKVQSAFGEAGAELKKQNSKEVKALKLQLKKEGKSNKEIRVIILAKEEEEKARIKAEEEAKKAEKPETSEQILSDIRQLLTNSAYKNVLPAENEEIKDDSLDAGEKKPDVKQTE